MKKRGIMLGVILLIVAGCQPSNEGFVGVARTATGTLAIVISRCDYGAIERIVVERPRGGAASEDDELLYSIRPHKRLTFLDTELSLSELPDVELYASADATFPRSSSAFFRPKDLPSVGLVQLNGKLRRIEAVEKSAQGC